jgi:uncharacterized protein (DUF736 family)
MADKKDVGAMWLKQTKSGDDFYSLTIEGVKYVAFRNNYKKSDNQPDFRIYPSEGGQSRRNDGPAFPSSSGDLDSVPF